MVLPGLAGIETKFAVAAATRGAPVNLKVSCRAGVTNSPSAVRGCRKTRRRLGVGALRWWLAAGWGRLARVPARSRRRGGLFQNSGFLKCARQLHAGVNQLDCTFPCQHNSRDNVSLAGWLGGRRFHIIQADRAKFEVGACGRRKGTGSRSRRTSPVCRVALPSETGSMGSLVRPAITGSTRQQLVAQRRRLSRIQGR